MNKKVKICGLYRDEDIEMVNELLPDYVGFVINYPKSHRNVTIDQVFAWKEKLSPQIKVVGVFVDQDSALIEKVAPCLDVVQLHGNEGVMKLAILQEILPNMEFWKAFAVKSHADIEKAMSFPAHKILLDYGKGEGKSFDWHLLDQVKKPFVLAGGISPENVAEAMALTMVEIIDVSSAVETDKVKDKEKIEKLLKNASRR